MMPAKKKISGFIRHLTVLRVPIFRRFYVGYSTSLLGTSMASIAVIFAVLGNGGSASDLGYVMAAGIVPRILLMLSGGVFADRIGRRPVMLGADIVRFGSQGFLAAMLFAGHTPIWLFIVASVLRGSGDAFFGPALTGLTTEMVEKDELGNANALLGVAQSFTSVIGPALAGLLVALTGARTVIAIDAATYAVSALALARLQLGRPKPTGNSLIRDLIEGFDEFKSRDWVWVTSVQFALFNLFTWGPYLLLGPVLAKQYLGGARDWGIVMAVYGLGAVLGGMLVLGRKPRRPVAVAAVASLGYPLPCAALALGAPVAVVTAAALAAGVGSALFLTLWYTALQQQVPAAALARVDSFVTVGAYAFGPVAFATAGAVAAVVGARTVLGVGAIWAVASTLAVLALPAVRTVTWQSAPVGDKEPVG
jgi:MFS family permease